MWPRLCGGHGSLRFGVAPAVTVFSNMGRRVWKVDAMPGCWWARCEACAHVGVSWRGLSDRVTVGIWSGWSAGVAWT
jgi:hypothetical protein